jgi:hypothetical protein
MTQVIEKLQGVTIAPGPVVLPPAADKLLSKVAEALTPTVMESTTRGPNWIDQQKNRSVVVKTNTQNELLATMMSLGLYTVSKDSAIALIANGHKLPMAEIDAALAKHNIDIQGRIKLKNAMDRYGIIKK